MGKSRRDLLKMALGGSGLWALRAAATGLPLSFIMRPTAFAAEECGYGADTDPQVPDFLILSVAQEGDPLNVNCPGAYVAGANNNPHPDLTPTSLYLAGKAVTAAAPWSTLPPALLDRMAFFHHRSHTVSHNQFEVLTRMHGSVKNADGRGEETLPSAIAAETAGSLATVQAEPVCLCSERITAAGVPLEPMSPSKLLALFQPSESVLTSLATLRDGTIDALHAEIKQHGTRNQLAFLERYETGRVQARSLGDCLGSLLERLPLDEDAPDNAYDQILTAVALLKLRVSPVVTVSVPFGGDNHNDPGLDAEASETVSGIAAIKFLWDELNAAGLQNQTTFACLNTFGRTLKTQANGRGHNGLHHTMAMFGRRIRGGVIGGIEPVDSDFAATAIDSASGASSRDGDIDVDATLQSAGKTLAAAVGLARERIDVRISGGKVVDGALV